MTMSCVPRGSDTVARTAEDPLLAAVRSHARLAACRRDVDLEGLCLTVVFDRGVSTRWNRDRPLLENHPAPSDLSETLTRDDLEQLDPRVPEHVRAEVESADPDLDQDVRDWFAPDCDRPRLTLLGPVAVRAHRAPIATRKPFFIEVLAYLALRGWSWLSVMNIDNHMVAPTSTWPTCSRDGSSPAATSEGQRSHRDGPARRPGGRSTPVKGRPRGPLARCWQRSLHL